MIRSFLFAAAALVVVMAAGCGGKSGGPQPTAPTVSMQGLRFHPAAVVVHAGQQVKWTNADNVDHNVTALSGATFKSQAFGHGQTYSFVANRPGTIHYVCTLHPGMNGTINVRK